MKPRLTKEMVDEYQTINPVSSQLRDKYGKEAWLQIFDYARIALHLEEHSNELFRLISKTLEAKDKTPTKYSQP